MLPAPSGCSELLGLRSGEVHDSQLSASTVHLTLGMELLSWRPEYARLGRRGKVNAWAAARNDQAQWLQVRKRGGGRGRTASSTGELGGSEIVRGVH